MKAFLVPFIPGETMSEYQGRVSGLGWVFTDSRRLLIPTMGTVVLDGDKPVGASFVEVPPPVFEGGPT